jgi:hypothetical protein
MFDMHQRIRMGQEIMRDQFAQILGNAEVFLGALKGFRRDLALSSKATFGNIQGEFTAPATIIAVPPLTDGISLSNLSAMLSVCTQAFFGTISIDIPEVMLAEEKEYFLEEIDTTHTNLMMISETAKRLYESIKNTGFDFDVFNTENIESEHVECNILFNRDALNVAMETARALAEHAVRLDIDLMDKREELDSKK